jgi:hypothetical protein
VAVPQVAGVCDPKKIEACGVMAALAIQKSAKDLDQCNKAIADFTSCVGGDCA